MLLTITPNPTVDRSLFVPDLTVGEVHRAARVHLAAGGKGLNVFRGARILGLSGLVTGPLAGATGTLIASLAEDEGIPAAWFYRKQGESRTCLLLHHADGDSTVINEPGSPLSSDDWDAFVQHCRNLSLQVSGICLSGSFPPDLPEGAVDALLSALEFENRPLLIDSSGAALQEALRRSILVKVNRSELTQALCWKGDADDWSGLHRARRSLVQSRSGRDSRPSDLIVTLGGQGAVWLGRRGFWRAFPPEVPVTSSVGSGDAFSAAVAAALLKNLPPEECLRRGVAAGTANLSSELPARFDKSRFSELLPAVTIRRIPE